MHCTSAQLLVLPYLVKAVKRYRGTSFIRKHTPLEPFCKPMPRIWEVVLGGWMFLYERVTPVDEPWL